MISATDQDRALGMDYYITDSPGCSGVIRSSPHDFLVDEVFEELSYEGGRYLVLEMEKTDWDTHHLIRELSRKLRISQKRFGWAGTKDKRAVTVQRISIMNLDEAELKRITLPGLKIKVLGRTNRSVSLGDLLGNRFRITIRDLACPEPGATLARITEEIVQQKGVPNYFGAQRFGHDGGNVEQGRAMLAREIRVRHPKKKGIYLSAVRSFVFNEVLALRVQQGLWGKTLPGDVLDEAGRPTGPLWGRGRVISTDQAQALENGVAERHATLCDGMEHAGLDQERRALVASPVDMSWEWPQGNQLVLTFSLPAGNYATSLVNEILLATEPDRHAENGSSAGE